MDAGPLNSDNNCAHNIYLVIEHPSFGRPVRQLVILVCLWLSSPPPAPGRGPGTQVPTARGARGGVGASIDTVVFNVGLHHLSLEDAAVTEYRAGVTNLMTIAQKHSHGYLLETISQHFCEEDGSYEQTALATKGKPLTARTNRNMECKGPYSVEAWRKTANWRNDVLAEIAKSMSFDKNVIQIAEYFLTTIGANTG
ncbi:hypothetical protein TrVE_jg2803 [Triparma verrucosa]|uniref:Uncharacterized protein n=1 Tax=Triparma verrucosa TaxID=1606542 RepID=A0A9W7BBB4_9STRA|nr:hypothetical protein TrVE_jg2803 [Triparma verrucosa]